MSGRHYDITVLLFNDGSPKWMNKFILNYIDSCTSIKIIYTEIEESHTKFLYWKLVTRNFESVRHYDSDYYIMLPDDAILTNNFLDEAVSKYELINDVNLICLNTFTDTIRYGNKSWGAVNHTPVKVGDVWNTGWVDMEFICTKRFFEALDYTIDPIPLSRWKVDSKLGSGVGLQISQRLTEKGYSIYQVDDSLTFQNEHDSVMNADRSFSIVAKKNMRDSSSGIHVHISTQASRKSGLEKTVRSLMSNSTLSDSIHIYANDYDDIPEWTYEFDCIFWYMNDLGDLKCAGRIYTAEKTIGYIFYVDDDLIYPQNYIETMISHIEYNDRKCIVTAHGATIPVKVTDYFKERTVYRCLGEVPKSTFVHIAGCGVTAYHTDTIIIDAYEMHGIINEYFFTDLWVSVAAQIKEIPILVIAHRQGWIKQTPESILDDSDGVFSRFKDSNAQAEIINRYQWAIHVPSTNNLNPELKCQLLQK
tara:strand:+ start:264 stop:1691 length:1428 start_codon:yes stop_codon:yes gene_type:complete